MGGKAVAIALNPTGQGAEVVTVTKSGIEHLALDEVMVSGAQATVRPIAIGGAGIAFATAAAGRSPTREFVVDGVRIIGTTAAAGMRITATDERTGNVITADQLFTFDRKDEPAIVLGTRSTARTIPMRDFFEAMDRALAASVARSLVIVDSPDGSTWTVTRLADLVDLAAESINDVSKVIVGADRIIVTVRTRRQSPDEIPRTIAFVARRS